MVGGEVLRWLSGDCSRDWVLGTLLRVFGGSDFSFDFSSRAHFSIHTPCDRMRSSYFVLKWFVLRPEASTCSSAKGCPSFYLLLALVRALALALHLRFDCPSVSPGALEAAVLSQVSMPAARGTA